MGGFAPGGRGETGPLESWHANLYSIDRRQCVLFCHDATRYCLFLPGLRAPQFAHLGHYHRELFLATLVAQGVTAAQRKRVELALGPVQFDCATDRSVLSSMTVARQDLDGMLARVTSVLSLDPAVAAEYLNDRPVTIKGAWLSPLNAMLECVAGLGE